MLITAIVRLAFDVQINPASGRVAVRRTESLYRILRRPAVGGRSFVDGHAFEPRFTFERPAAARSEQYLILRFRRDKTQRQFRPVARACER